MKQIFLAAATLFIILFQSCTKDGLPVVSVSGTFKGEAITMGNGKAWTWAEIDNQAHPKTVGISFEQAAFTNLPAGNAGMEEVSYEPKLPLEKELTPFSHIVIDWNPHGHPPSNIYDKPHFDLHFYMMNEADRVVIPEYQVDSSGFLQYPAPAYLPATYFPIPGGEAKMGVHWADGTSPELNSGNPQPFTQTFIYGSYKGNVTFYEPMATLAFLTTTTSYTRSIPQPAKWSKDGYYPTPLSFTKTNGIMQVTLSSFVFHAKS